MQELKSERGLGVITEASHEDRFLCTRCNGRQDVFAIVDEFPAGYRVWNIGRKNFPFAGYVPLCRVKEGDYHVVLDELCAIKCASEDIALRVLKNAGRRTVSRKQFYQMNQEQK